MLITNPKHALQSTDHEDLVQPGRDIFKEI